MIDRAHPVSVTRQAQLLSLSRSSVYYEPVGTSDTDLVLMAPMEEIHLQLPFYGIRRPRGELLDRGLVVGREHVATLLRGLDITHAGHVWVAGITDVPVAKTVEADPRQIRLGDEGCEGPGE
jgi:hypothetical protein